LSCGTFSATLNNTTETLRNRYKQQAQYPNNVATIHPLLFVII
jgi:hypothetical protein